MFHLFLQPTYIISLLIAITVHEWSHAMTATRLGDPTPGNAGRLSLNPLAHLDPLGALLFLAVGFGWAKPVPINPSYFHHPRRDTVLVALTGPLSNLILASLAFIGLIALGGGTVDSVWNLLSVPVQSSAVQTFFFQLCTYSLFTNLALMAFNLLPIAPLDGSRVLEAFIHLHYEDRYSEWMRWGPYVLLALFLGEQFFGLHLLSDWITGIMDGVLHLMAGIAGMFGR